MIRPNPIPDSFMLTGMVGLLLSFIFTSTGNLPEQYGYALGLFFGIMLLSSLVSVTPQLPRAAQREDVVIHAAKAPKKRKSVPKPQKPAAKAVKKKPAKKAASKKKPVKKAAKKSSKKRTSRRK